jgi:hypothetical protein
VAKRIKKGEPEMLIVSFCDIVTITTAAMFFAMLITVQEAVKIPVFRPTPRSIPTDKQVVFFECRNNELFNIDKARLDDQVADLLNSVNPGVRGGDLTGFLKAIQGRQVTNQYYKVNPSYLLTAIMALEPRPEAPGENLDDVDRTNGKYQYVLQQLDPKKQYVAFLVRDDSFQMFRKARQVADKHGFDTGWELLGIDEPIKFGAGGQSVNVQ